jgi:hypothetical protein
MCHTTYMLLFTLTTLWYINYEITKVPHLSILLAITFPMDKKIMIPWNTPQALEWE